MYKIETLNQVVSSVCLYVLGQSVTSEEQIDMKASITSIESEGLEVAPTVMESSIGNLSTITEAEKTQWDGERIKLYAQLDEKVRFV